MKLPAGDLNEPRIDVPTSSIQVKGSELLAIAVEVAKEIWRLQQAVDRNKSSALNLSEEVGASLSRLRDALASAEIEVVDPTGQDHHAGSRYQITHITDGEGDLFISETLIPAVRIAGQQISPATVILGHRGNTK